MVNTLPTLSHHWNSNAWISPKNLVQTSFRKITGSQWGNHMAVIYPPVFLHCLQLYHLGSSFKVSRCWDSTETDMAESNPKRHKRWKDSLTICDVGNIFAEKFQDLTNSVGLVYLEVHDIHFTSSTPVCHQSNLDPSSPARLELPTRFQPNHHRGQYSEQSPDGNRAMHRTIFRWSEKTGCFPMGKRWLVLSECKGKLEWEALTGTSDWMTGKGIKEIDKNVFLISRILEEKCQWSHVMLGPFSVSSCGWAMSTWDRKSMGFQQHVNGESCGAIEKNKHELVICMILP